MQTKATGTFEVKMTPQTWAETQPDAAKSLSRFLLEKVIHGDLEATTQGQMLAAGDGKPGGSGVYVAVEKVTGTLHGRNGSFVFHHTGVMTNGSPDLKINVVPGSGTDELHGLAGEMKMQIENGQHHYEFLYTLTTLQ